MKKLKAIQEKQYLHHKWEKSPGEGVEKEEAEKFKMYS